MQAEEQAAATYPVEARSPRGFTPHTAASESASTG